jgi:hypothetical protein
MLRGIAIIVGLTLIFLIMISGCTTSEEKNQTVIPVVTEPVKIVTETPKATPASITTNPTVTPTIWDETVSQPPADLAVSISVDKDQIYYTITVTFNGGAGQSLIKNMQVRFVSSDGKEEIKPLGSRMGDSVEFNGTDRNDRIQVAVWYMTGASYLIYDQKVGFQPPMPN